MQLPNFIVIGAAKSGTTSLHRYLSNHPEIYVPARREPSFFAHEGEHLDYRGPGDNEWSFVTNVEKYRRLFGGADSYKAVGDISPRYLYFERACDRIKHYIPDARLIAVLRHPVDRAYSHFLMNRNRYCEPESNFRTALEKGPERVRLGWGWDWQYVEAGLYYKQLKRYYQRFDPGQLKIFLYDEYKVNPDEFFNSLFRFLEVNSSFRPDTSVRHRAAALPRMPAVRAFLNRPHTLKTWAVQLLPYHLLKGFYRQVRDTVNGWNSRPPDPLAQEVRQELFERYFEADCAQLEALIGRDLSIWRGAGIHEMA